MYNCSKWPVPLQLNVTLLLPGILWLRNMLLVLPIVHNPPTVFSVTGDLEPSFVLVKFPTPLLVVSSSLSPPHPLSSPPSPPSSIYTTSPRLAGTWKKSAVLSSNAWRRQRREHSKKMVYQHTHGGESSLGEGLVGVWHCSDEYTKTAQKKLESHGRRFCTMYWNPQHFCSMVGRKQSAVSFLLSAGSGAS